MIFRASKYELTEQNCSDIQSIEIRINRAKFCGLKIGKQKEKKNEELDRIKERKSRKDVSGNFIDNVMN